jgi:RNA polymerase sigma factor (sigma-70 family)
MRESRAGRKDRAVGLVRAVSGKPATLTWCQGAQPASAPGSPGPLRAVTADTYPDWEAVYRDNIGRVYRLMFAKVGSQPDAEDLTTEVFLAVLRPLRLPASVGEVRAYLFATARTVLARYWARTLGHPVTTLHEDPGEIFSEPQMESMAQQRAARILAELPERYRRILQLRFLEACSVAEAAQALGITVANAKVLQHRALRRAAEIAAEQEE